MRSPLRLLVLAFAVAMLAIAPVAFAASPHYIRGPTATVDGNSLVVSWKAAGLGNTTTSVDFNLAGTVTTTAQCFTRSGNPVQGVPKTETEQRQLNRDVPGAQRAGDRRDDGRAAVHAHMHRQPGGYHPER